MSNELIIDATDPNNLSNKVMPEWETRKKLLHHAKLVGCEGDMLKLFAKFDKLMKNCTNNKEKELFGYDCREFQLNAEYLRQKIQRQK